MIHQVSQAIKRMAGDSNKGASVSIEPKEEGDFQLIKAFAASDKAFQHKVMGVALATNSNVLEVLRAARDRGLSLAHAKPVVNDRAEIRFKRVH